MQRLPQLIEFAAAHKLKIISIADLIAYRQRREQLVERTMEFEVQTRIGKARAVAYKTRFEDAEHIALIFGDLDGSVPVRIHREKLLDDIFGPQAGHARSLLDVSLDRIEQLGGGVLIYLRSGLRWSAAWSHWPDRARKIHARRSGSRSVWARRSCGIWG